MLFKEDRRKNGKWMYSNPNRRPKLQHIRETNAFEQIVGKTNTFPNQKNQLPRWKIVVRLLRRIESSH